MVLILYRSVMSITKKNAWVGRLMFMRLRAVLNHNEIIKRLLPAVINGTVTS